ncbi:MAG TPA: hypothetical protein PKA63_06435 [Oligoflexia bacterium]|nr:hypothetical protein [Oligoflexia bacterium]HMP48286.1 hypothetical protein [Oligoflexia bacterium]
MGRNFAMFVFGFGLKLICLGVFVSFPFFSLAQEVEEEFGKQVETEVDKEIEDIDQKTRIFRDVRGVGLKGVFLKPVAPSPVVPTSGRILNFMLNERAQVIARERRAQIFLALAAIENDNLKVSSEQILSSSSIVLEKIGRDISSLELKLEELSSNPESILDSSVPEKILKIRELVSELGRELGVSF